MNIYIILEKLVIYDVCWDFFYSATTVCIEWASCSWSYWTTVFFDAHNSGSETLLLTLLSFDVRSIQLPFHDVQYMYCMRSVGSISHTSLSLKIITFTRYPFYWKRNLNTCLPTDDSQWRMRAIAVIRGWQNIPAIAVFSQPLTLLQNILSFCNDLFLIVKLQYTLLNVLVVTSHLMKF